MLEMQNQLGTIMQSFEWTLRLLPDLPVIYYRGQIFQCVTKTWKLVREYLEWDPVCEVSMKR